MGDKVLGLPLMQRNKARTVTLLVVFSALAAIPFVVMYGRLGKGSVLVSNLLSCALLGNLGLTAVCRISMRARGFLGK